MNVVALNRFNWLVLVVGLWLAFGVSPAQAQGGFFDSNFVSLNGICPVTNIPVVVSQNSVGYFTDPSNSYPKTGDVVYVRATSTNVSGCLNDVVGFDFFFPANTVFAIDATNKVRCYRVRISDGQAEEFVQDSNGACSQTPGVGTSGGNSFGWSALASGFRLDIRVPVRFNQQLLGLAGPNTHKLQAVADTTWGKALAELAVTSFYEADFDTFVSNNITSSSARVNADLYSYYKSGTASIDYGTTTSLGQSVSIGNIADAQIGYGIFADLENLSANTTYFWQARYVTASGTFNSPTQSFTTGAAQNVALTVNKAGSGNGTVSSSPAGIDCGTSCIADFGPGTTVTLTQTAASGSTFAGWGGACSGSGSCVVSMDAAKSVTATFNTTPIATFALTVNKTGPGSGTLSSTPGGISCGATCNATFNDGTLVTLSASPNAGSSFAGWSGACSGTGGCTVTMNAAKIVSATFELIPAGSSSLTVSRQGSGSGTVSSSPAGINCGSTCVASFTDGSVITLTANPAAGSSFIAWGGACSGTGACSVTLDSAKTVSVTFDTNQAGTFAVSVSKTGSGSVSSNPSGINCGLTCTANFASGASITLTATPDTGFNFVGWGGACSGTGTCNVTADASQTVSATFQSNTNPATPVTASKGTNLPADVTTEKGASNIPVLSFGLSGNATLSSVTLKSTGTGNDALDLSNLKLYLDANGNGKVDAGETALAQGKFSADNGETTLTLTTPLTLSSSSQFLIAVDINTQLAALAALPLLGFAAFGFIKRKPMQALLFVTLISLIMATGCGEVTPAKTSTYQLSLSEIAVTTTLGANVEVTGLPIQGTALTIKP